jgi:hypothetical protein
MRPRARTRAAPAADASRSRGAGAGGVAGAGTGVREPRRGRPPGVAGAPVGHGAGPATAGVGGWGWQQGLDALPQGVGQEVVGEGSHGRAASHQPPAPCHRPTEVPQWPVTVSAVSDRICELSTPMVGQEREHVSLCSCGAVVASTTGGGPAERPGRAGGRPARCRSCLPGVSGQHHRSTQGRRPPSSCRSSTAGPARPLPTRSWPASPSRSATAATRSATGAA